MEDCSFRIGLARAAATGARCRREFSNRLPRNLPCAATKLADPLSRGPGRWVVGAREALMKQIHKIYPKPFLLEKTKLDRLMAIIHGRLGDHQGTTNRDDFEV